MLTLNYSEIAKLKNQNEDLQNRSRRNNIILHGIPEGAEGSQKCEEFVSSLIINHMKLQDGEAIEIERAHRTPGRKPANPATVSGPSRPRPIHCKLLRFGDREFILKNAAKSLRNNPYKNSNIFITDDVTERIRNFRKQLRENELQTIRRDHRVHFAYIPWSIPPMIKYKLHTGAFKTYRCGEAIPFQ